MQQVNLFILYLGTLAAFINYDAEYKTKHRKQILHQLAPSETLISAVLVFQSAMTSNATLVKAVVKAFARCSFKPAEILSTENRGKSKKQRMRLDSSRETKTNA